MSARHKSFFLSTSFFISREHFSEVISLFALDGIRQTHTVSKIPQNSSGNLIASLFRIV